MKVVLGLSGGMDSAALCAFYLDNGYRVVPINFEYGSKHNKYEAEAAKRLVKYFKLPDIVNIGLPFISQLFTSHLLQKGGAIPEGHYKDKNMSLTVVPGRNIIFISIMAGYAWSIGADIVAYGAHSGDHAIYEDCRPEFFHSMSMAVSTGTGKRITLEAPFLNFTKADIINSGRLCTPSVPWEHTRTCYKDQPISCGKCGSCVERLEAFNLVGLPDPIPYENDKRVPKY